MKNNKKILLWLLGLVLILGICVGAYLIISGVNASSEPFTFKVTLNNGEIPVLEKEILPKADQSLLDAMKENCEVAESNGLVTAIEGHAQDYNTNTYWFFEINGEFSDLGAGEYYPKEGDIIEFDLHAWVEE